MTNDTGPLDVSATAKQVAAQAYAAMDGYFDGLKKAVSSAPSGGTEFGEKLKTYTEKNIDAAQKFLNQMSQAKDLQEMFRIQTEFLQAQFNAFGEQTKSLGEAFAKTASGGVKVPLQPSS